MLSATINAAAAIEHVHLDLFNSLVCIMSRAAERPGTYWWMHSLSRRTTTKVSGLHVRRDGIGNSFTLMAEAAYLASRDSLIYHFLNRCARVTQKGGPDLVSSCYLISRGMLHKHLPHFLLILRFYDHSIIVQISSKFTNAVS
jgi:hypothetical protein